MSLSRLWIIFVVLLVAPRTLVSGCEGDCIIGITNALVGNYSIPIAQVFSQMSDSITSCLGGKLSTGSSSSNTDSDSLLEPIMKAYDTRSYDAMKHGIFTRYFHGKCQNPETGVDPAGCPNPDCPVVCGTPGSIVHFYEDFRRLAFESVLKVFVGDDDDGDHDSGDGGDDAILSIDSEAFKEVEQRIESEMRDAGGYSRFGRRLQGRRRRWRITRDGDVNCGAMDSDSDESESSIESLLKGVFGQFRKMMVVACGGSGDDDDNGENIPGCSWENEFKSYILSFP